MNHLLQLQQLPPLPPYFYRYHIIIQQTFESANMQQSRMPLHPLQHPPTQGLVLQPQKTSSSVADMPTWLHDPA